MATNSVSLTRKVWKLLSAVSCSFQVVGGHEVYVTESVALPTDLDNYKVANVRGMYTFSKNDGNLYGYCEDGNAVVGIDVIP